MFTITPSSLICSLIALKSKGWYAANSCGVGCDLWLLLLMIVQEPYSHISPAYQQQQQQQQQQQLWVREHSPVSYPGNQNQTPSTAGFDVSSDQPALTSPTWCCREQQVRARAWSFIFTGTTPQLLCVRLKCWSGREANSLQVAFKFQKGKRTLAHTERESSVIMSLCVQSDQSLTALLLINPDGMWDQVSNYFIHGHTVAGWTGWLSSHKSLSDFKWAPAVFIQRRYDLCHKASVDTGGGCCFCSWSLRSHQDQIRIRSSSGRHSHRGTCNVSSHSRISLRYQRNEGCVFRKQGNDALAFQVDSLSTGETL